MEILGIIVLVWFLIKIFDSSEDSPVSKSKLNQPVSTRQGKDYSEAKGHDITNGICKNCGCSEKAIVGFGWSCSKSDSSGKKQKVVSERRSPRSSRERPPSQMEPKRHLHHPKNMSPRSNMQRLSLKSFILTDTSNASLRKVIGSANSHLVALRKSGGTRKYGRVAAIKLTGETIVAFKMASQLLHQNQMGTSTLSLRQAEGKVESLRRDLYADNEEVFEPFFENEPGIVDLDLSLFRRASNQAANGDETALSQIEYMFTYYHTVLGMYYGWQSLVLSGKSVSNAAAQVTGTTNSGLQPPTLQVLTAHFGAVLVKQHPGTVGKFEPLYAPPSH
jgi:hypothetical protein